MKIEFYAPLKSPHHPVPSGDRLMARMLVSALGAKGHIVRIASELRSFSKAPDPKAWTALTENADREVERISERWRTGPVPDLWFCYHPYYKAPDLIGPRLADQFGLTYVTAESSYAAKRDGGPWGPWQACVRESLEQAAVNICLTERDRAGILASLPAARTASLKPFIDTSRFANGATDQTQPHVQLMTVAMMRDGDKFDSYEVLAKALARLPSHLSWHLAVIGDGPKALEVKALFADFPSDRITWLGAKTEAEVTQLLRHGSIYVWPGCGEAYGLAYLEAQASGLPVVAQDIAGVPEVVVNGVTGILTQPGDIEAYSDAIADLISDSARRKKLSTAARDFVMQQRSLDRAADQLDKILWDAMNRGQ